LKNDRQIATACKLSRKPHRMQRCRLWRYRTLLQPGQPILETRRLQPHGVRDARYAGLTYCPQNRQQAN